MAEQVTFTQPTTGNTVTVGARNYAANYARLFEKPAPKKARKKKDEKDVEGRTAE